MPSQVEWTVRGKQCYPLGLRSQVSTFAVAHLTRFLASDPSSAPACLRVVLKLPCTRPDRVCEVVCSHTPDASLSANCHPFEGNSQEPRQRTAFANVEPLTHLVIEPRGKLTVS